VTATCKTKLLALDAQDFHALIERLPDLAAHVKDTAEARLADTAGAPKGDLAPAEIAQRNAANGPSILIPRATTTKAHRGAISSNKQSLNCPFPPRSYQPV
jgi:hypothetical protein